MLSHTENTAVPHKSPYDNDSRQLELQILLLAVLRHPYSINWLLGSHLRSSVWLYTALCFEQHLSLWAEDSVNISWGYLFHDSSPELLIKSCRTPVLNRNRSTQLKVLHSLQWETSLTLLHPPHQLSYCLLEVVYYQRSKITAALKMPVVWLIASLHCLGCWWGSFRRLPRTRWRMLIVSSTLFPKILVSCAKSSWICCCRKVTGLRTGGLMMFRSDWGVTKGENEHSQIKHKACRTTLLPESLYSTLQDYWTNKGTYACIGLCNETNTTARQGGERVWVSCLERPPQSLGNVMKRTSITQISLHFTRPHEVTTERYLRIFCGSQQHRQMCEQADQNEDNGGHGSIRHSLSSPMLCISEDVASLSSVFTTPVGKHMYSNFCLDKRTREVTNPQ